MAIKQESLEKLGPRLRMICNGDEEVNALRSELSATVQAPQAVAKRHRAKEMLQQAAKKPAALETVSAPPSDQPLTDAVKVSCFVRLADPARPSEMLPSTQVRRGELVTVELTPREIEAIADLGPETGIAAIETGEPLALPHPVVTPRAVTEPPSRVPKSVLTVGPVVPIDRTVPAVLIGIVDVGGFDFAHTDFLTTDGTQKTRFVSIWDQGASKGSP